MRSVLLLAASLFALSPVAALAAGNPAIANQTSTSLGTPQGYPCYNQPHPEVAPGLPAHAEAHQEHLERACNSGHGTTAQMQAPGNGRTMR